MSGHLHPVGTLLNQLVSHAESLGFSVATGPEVVAIQDNFDLLNIGPNHPARDTHDTFYVSDKEVLRTHTSALQVPIVRAKLKAGEQPPFRLLFPGRVYRNEATDATHNSQFFQLEGLVVDPTANLAELLTLLEGMIRSVAGKTKVEFRFRPSYFPFVEPGLEMDIRLNGGEWLELLGAGMVHQQVMQNMGLDPTKYRGFAFGLGVERLLMLLTGLDDVRLVFAGDYRYLGQS